MKGHGEKCGRDITMEHNERHVMIRVVIKW